MKHTFLTNCPFCQNDIDQDCRYCVVENTGYTRFLQEEDEVIYRFAYQDSVYSYLFSYLDKSIAFGRIDRSTNKYHKIIILPFDSLPMDIIVLETKIPLILALS